MCFCLVDILRISCLGSPLRVSMCSCHDWADDFASSTWAMQKKKKGNERNAVVFLSFVSPTNFVNKNILFCLLRFSFCWRWCGPPPHLPQSQTYVMIKCMLHVFFFLRNLQSVKKISSLSQLTIACLCQVHWDLMSCGRTMLVCRHRVAQLFWRVDFFIFVWASRVCSFYSSHGVFSPLW
jgi:hypothetical protein